MGALNEWARGSFLEPPENRRVVTVALNLLYGAAMTLRQAHLRSQGVNPDGFFPRGPLERDELERRLGPRD
jgi:hypothetical protein